MPAMKLPQARMYYRIAAYGVEYMVSERLEDNALRLHLVGILASLIIRAVQHTLRNHDAKLSESHKSPLRLEHEPTVRRGRVCPGKSGGAGRQTRGRRGLGQEQVAVKNKKHILRKRSVIIAGHKTSVSLEEVFWIGVKEIAAARNIPVNKLVAEIAEQVAKGEHFNLSSALRVLVVEFYRDHGQQHKKRVAKPLR
jgi:predicted DNA-binding ribbon-helix-helix protein